jgi:hypothetical protein
LIDTPGFDDTWRSDSEILTEIAGFLSTQYQLGMELKGVIYIHRITDARYSQSAAKTFEIVQKICGERAWQNVLLVTSLWTEVNPEMGAGREFELKTYIWDYMLARGSIMSRFYGDRDSAIALVIRLLCKNPIVLELQKELVDEGKRLDETSAGLYINDNLEKLKKRYEQDLASLEKLRRELLKSDPAMNPMIQRDLEDELARLRQAQEQQVSLQRPVSSEVCQEISAINDMKSRIMKD